jgi:processive 1,2-diacylglycerol beta-glucosyltransferase
MPRLFFQESGETIGEISQDQLQFLIDQLEEEDTTDQDYYVNRDTLDMFREAGCDEALLDLLTKAMGEAEDIDIAWE